SLLGSSRFQGDHMSASRREFLARTAAGIVGAAAAGKAVAEAAAPEPTPTPVPAEGTPPAFGTAPPVGPPITTTTVAEAEKPARAEYPAAERQQPADSWPRSMASTMERRTGPRKLAIETTTSPATLWNPMIPGIPAGPSQDRFVRSAAAPGPLPKNDA